MNPDGLGASEGIPKPTELLNPSSYRTRSITEKAPHEIHENKMNSIDQLLKSATALVTSMLPTTRGALKRAKAEHVNWIFSHGYYVPDIDEEGNSRMLFIMPIRVEPEQQDYIEELIENFENHHSEVVFRKMLG
jgi:hypothetical protein